jgi:acyl-CoA hydrolase
MSELDLGAFVRAGDAVLVGQAAAEPLHLVDQLLKVSETVENLTAVCGYVQSPAWERVTGNRLRVKSYAAHGSLRALSRQGLLEIIPLHYSHIEQVIASRQLPIDVVLLQVGPVDADGFYDLGATVDFALAAIEHARAVIVEVNDRMPRTNSTTRLHSSKVTASISTSAPLANSPARPASELEKKVAANVAHLIPSGAMIQLGVGALPDAIAHSLRDHRQLSVRSGLVGDWLVDLYEAGALATEPGNCVTGIALGGERLYSFLSDTDIVRMAPISEQISAAAMKSGRPYMSINSGIEIDLLGQVGSEIAGSRYVGAVGGQGDFFRASRSSEGGLAIIAMPSTSPSGSSRIVRELTGPVTSLKSDIDVVVTDWGAAEISAASLSERAERITSIAAPEHRDALNNARPNQI